MIKIYSDSKNLNSVLRNLSSQLGITISLIGFVVLLGWMFNLPVLKTVLPGLMMMKINTTLGFIFSGISLWLWHKYRQTRQSQLKLLFQILAVFVSLLGWITLIQHGFNINLGIDKLLTKEGENAIFTSYPPRMALNTDLCFLCLGSALILLPSKLVGITQTLAFSSLLIALLGLIGYLFDIGGFYDLAPLTSMTLHTSILFLLLGIGVLLVEPERGWVREVMSPYLGGMIARNLLPLVIGMPILTSGLFLSAYRNNTINIEAALIFPSIFHICALGTIVWWNARYLNATDKKYQNAQQALQASHENLETKIQKPTSQLELANQALANSRLQLSNLINTLPGIVFSRSFNSDYSIQNLSDGYLSIIGCSAKELSDGDRTFQDLIVPEDVPKIVAAIQIAIKNKNAYEVEYRIHTQCGQEKWLWEKGIETLIDGNNSIQGFITEITSLKQTQVALSKSEERWRLATSCSLDAIWEWDGASDTTTLSERWFNLLGKKAQNLTITRTEWMTYLHPDDCEQVIKKVEDYITHRTPQYHSEYRLRHQDGSYKWVESQAIAQWDETGNPVRLVGSIADITERKQAEQALKDSEAKFRELAENIHEVFHINSADLSQMLYVSPGYEEIWGRSCESLYQHPESWSESIHPDDRVRFLAACERLIEGEPLKQEYRIMTPNGAISWILARVFPIYSQSGIILRHVGIAADITERKQAELKIHQLNEQLEEIVQQRTAELRAANKELEAFSYSVSHDLRAPLRSMDGFSRTLLERYQDQLDDKGKHYLTRIRVGTQRMGELIDSLLQLSRVTRTQMQYNQVNISVIAQEIAQELAETEPKRQVEWVISPNLIVQGDAHLLRIVMENLLNNAWKFTSNQIQAKIEFTTLVSESKNTDYLTYIVRDNGVGFDQTYANKLFQAFQRLHSVEEFPGTGIGLATVQRIIRRHGGDVWVNASVGEGATFYFTL